MCTFTSTYVALIIQILETLTTWDLHKTVDFSDTNYWDLMVINCEAQRSVLILFSPGSEIWEHFYTNNFLYQISGFGLEAHTMSLHFILYLTVSNRFELLDITKVIINDTRHLYSHSRLKLCLILMYQWSYGSPYFYILLCVEAWLCKKKLCIQGLTLSTLPEKCTENWKYTRFQKRCTKCEQTRNESANNK